ncbi:hypothetical protein AYO40_05815 [Planctomycetaceae bacterium SCGC AG-212-D15]|nr:hypothetical protein AYO40_05815 [Planctomycetaceae bacterium SCGC AG-212-D15]
MDEVTQRIERIYAAIDASMERDPTKFPAKIAIQEGIFIGMWQDFSCGESEAQLSNIAHSVIHNIANLQDHLRKWAAHNGKDRERVDAIVKATPALKIIKDLSDRDKHGGPRRDGGSSGLEPRLEYIRRVMLLRTKPEPNSEVLMTVNLATGETQFGGDGSASAVVTAEVRDKGNNLIGELVDFQHAAVEGWEALLREYGVALH